MRAPLRPGQVDNHFGEFAGFGLDPDVAAVLADDVAGEREAEAGALVGRLGREEGMEDLLDQLVRDAAAIVPDADFDAVRGCRG